MAKSPREDRSLAEEIADDASNNTLALNPLVGLRMEDLVKAQGTVLKALATSPQAVAAQWMNFAGEFSKIVMGNSEVAPDPKDRRFADPAWKSSNVHKALAQSYMAWGKAVTEMVADTKLDAKDAARARLVTSIFVDAMAPSNNPFLNPTALKTALDSGGKSAVAGLKNFFDDMTKNGGLPSSVDASKFKVGENLANSPGSVVFRNEILEVIHYKATTEQVYQRPLLIVPPQINKYYSVDLSPDKSMVRFLTANGIQPYCVSTVYSSVGPGVRCDARNHRQRNRQHYGFLFGRHYIVDLCRLAGWSETEENQCRVFGGLRPGHRSRSRK
jgi:polyhydroxyalkanoate synthase